MIITISRDEVFAAYSKGYVALQSIRPEIDKFMAECEDHNAAARAHNQWVKLELRKINHEYMLARQKYNQSRNDLSFWGKFFGRKQMALPPKPVFPDSEEELVKLGGFKKLYNTDVLQGMVAQYRERLGQVLGTTSIVATEFHMDKDDMHFFTMCRDDKLKARVFELIDLNCQEQFMFHEAATWK